MARYKHNKNKKTYLLRLMWLGIMLVWYILGLIFFIRMFHHNYAWYTYLWQFPLRYLLWSCPFGAVECYVLHGNTFDKIITADEKYNKEKHIYTAWVKNGPRDVTVNGTRYIINDNSGRYEQIWDQRDNGLLYLGMFMLLSPIIFPFDFIISLIIILVRAIKSK